MATTTNGAAARFDAAEVGVEDVTGVRSRVSWQAIIAGSVVALAVYLVLTLLGSAIGLSVADRVDGRSIGIGAAVYAIVVTALALFSGGFVASQMTAGENKREGAMYGLFVWGIVLAALMFLLAGGVKAGFSAMVGVATAGSAVSDTASRNFTQADAEDALRRAGYSQQEMDQFRDRVKNAPADLKAATEDPATRQRVEQETKDTATRVAWYSVLGAVLSLAAAIAGGFVGAGPHFRIFAVRTRPAGYAPRA